MKRPSFFGALTKRLEKKAVAREALLRAMRDVRQSSKRAVFAFHRGDAQEAESLLESARLVLVGSRKTLGAFPEFATAGLYREGLEEYIEARLFQGFLVNRSLLPPEDGWDDETYLSGWSDATGEVVRWALARATEHNDAAVEEAMGFVRQAVESFLMLDLSGYVRTKADQAKKNLRTIEEMRYELSLRAR